MREGGVSRGRKGGGQRVKGYEGWGEGEGGTHVLDLCASPGDLHH